MLAGPTRRWIITIARWCRGWSCAVATLLDSAVQESMLAIPYAMAKLDSISQAADHYLNAIEAFYEEGNRIDRTILSISSLGRDV